MPASLLIHPRLTRNLHNIFNCRATIQNATVTTDSFNDSIIVWTDDPLLVALPCYIEPASGGEQRQAGNTLVSNLWNVILADFYPNISKQQQITVNDVAYNIVDISVESTDTITALVVEKVSV